MSEILNQTDIEKIKSILENNKIVAVPTDTVFGICGSINSIISYNKIMDIKNRPSNKLLPVMCANLEQISSITDLKDKDIYYINKYMPGAITFILKTKINKDSIISKNHTVAIRMAPTEFIKNLLVKLDSPVFMTSANISGENVYKNANEIASKMPKLDAVVEGEVKYNMASTIVDLTQDKPVIIRQGPVIIEELEK